MKAQKQKRLMKARVKMAVAEIIRDAYKHRLIVSKVEGNTITLNAFKMEYDYIDETGVIHGREVPYEGEEHRFVVNVPELLESLEDFSFGKNRSKRQRKRRREAVKRNLQERLAFIKAYL